MLLKIPKLYGYNIIINISVPLHLGCPQLDCLFCCVFCLKYLLFLALCNNKKTRYTMSYNKNNYINFTIIVLAVFISVALLMLYY